MSKISGKQATFAGACKWPDDESKLSDYLEKKKKPANTWITYKNVKILKFCKSVRQAKEEVEKALDVSDLSHSDRDKSTKRQRFVTARYSPPSKEKSYNRHKRHNIRTDDSESESEFKAPPVPGLKISGRKKNNEASLPVNNDSNSDESDTDLDDNCTQETQKDCSNSDTETSETYRNSDRYNNKNVMTRYDHNKNFDVPISSNLHGSQVADTSINDNGDGVNNDVTDFVHLVHTKEKEKSNIEDLQTNKQDKVLCRNEKSNIQDSQTNKQDKVVCRNEKSNSTNSCKPTQQSHGTVDAKTIMTAINELRNQIDKLHATVTKIYTATCNPIETLENSTTNNIPTLPLTSIEEFWKWEDYISDEENKLRIISLLVEHGREDLKSSVYCIMRKLINNKVAMNFNLKGINREGAKMEKKKFLDTISYKLVIAAVKRHKKEMTDRGVNFLYNTEIAASYIASWLKDAKKRHENEEMKLKKIEQRDKDCENNANA